MKHSTQNIQYVNGLASKPSSFKSFSPETDDVIELGMNLKTKNRDTLLNACLSGELDSVDESDFANHVNRFNYNNTNISCKSYRKRQIVIAPTGVGKTTLFVLEALYKTMVSEDGHFIVFLSSSTDLVPETVSRLKKVLISYIFDEEPKFGDTVLRSLDAFKNIGSRGDRLRKFIERDIGLIKIVNNYSSERLQIVTNSFSNMNQMDELEIDYKLIRRSTNRTDQVTKRELFTVFYEAITEPEESRNEDQEKAIELLENALINKYTTAVAAERERKEGNKPMGFFKNFDGSNSKQSGRFLKTLEAIGYPSHNVFMSFPGYTSESERHVVFTPQLQRILDYINKASRFSKLSQSFRGTSRRMYSSLRIDENDAFEGSYKTQLTINMPYKLRERKFLYTLSRKAKQGLKYGALVGTDILPYPALQFRNVRPRDEIKTVYRPLLSLSEPTFDTVEKLHKIKYDMSRGAARSDVVFREGLILNIETGASLLIDGNNLCKTIEKISVYDNCRGEFVEILTLGLLDSSNLHLKVSLIPNINNLNYIIHSKKGALGSKEDGDIVQGVLQVILRKLLTSTNTFTVTNSITKTDRLFRKDVDKFGNIRTISDLMILSFGEAKLLYNNYWAKLTKAEKRNNPVSKWMSGPSVGIWLEESLVTTQGFFYQTLMDHFDDVKGFSATDHEFFRKSFYNQVAPIEYLLAEKEYDLIGKIFGLDLEDFCNLPENFSRFYNQDE